MFFTGLLCENFVTWGWDLTFNSNKQRLLDMIRHSTTDQPFNFFLLDFLIVAVCEKLRSVLDDIKIRFIRVELM